MEANLFRIGGVYRDRQDTAYQVTAKGERWMLVSVLEEDGSLGPGMQHFHDGRFHATANKPDSLFHLIPGELTQINGEWVPIADRFSPTPTLDKLEAEKEVLCNGLTVEETNATASVMGVDPKKDAAQQLRELVEIQGMDGTWNADDYMVGMFNGMELALSILEDRDPQYRTLKPKQQEPASTAHAPLAGLSLSPERSSTHWLGGSFVR